MITYTTYRREDGTGPAWLCGVMERGNALIFYTGATEQMAREAARNGWEKDRSTPEGRQRRGEIAKAARGKKKEAGNG